MYQDYILLQKKTVKILYLIRHARVCHLST